MGSSLSTSTVHTCSFIKWLSELRLMKRCEFHFISASLFVAWHHWLFSCLMWLMNINWQTNDCWWKLVIRILIILKTLRFNINEIWKTQSHNFWQTGYLCSSNINTMLQHWNLLLNISNISWIMWWVQTQRFSRASSKVTGWMIFDVLKNDLKFSFI